MSASGHSILNTHDVQNQPEPRVERDLWAEDQPLREQMAHAGADLAALASAGQAFGTQEMKCSIDVVRLPARHGQ